VNVSCVIRPYLPCVPKSCDRGCAKAPSSPRASRSMSESASLPAGSSLMTGSGVSAHGSAAASRLPPAQNTPTPSCQEETIKTDTQVKLYLSKAMYALPSCLELECNNDSSPSQCSRPDILDHSQAGRDLPTWHGYLLNPCRTGQGLWFAIPVRFLQTYVLPMCALSSSIPLSKACLALPGSHDCGGSMFC